MSRISHSSHLRRADRGGFTLVELLVVITIIGILMALLLPVLGRAREFAHRVACMNNQREIGQATMQYATTKSHMPPELEYYVDTAPGVAANTTYILGWAECMMGYLGRSDLQPGTLPIATLRTALPNVPVLVCPSDSNKSGSAGGPLSYIVNGGCPNAPTILTAGQPVDANANGAWNYFGETTSPTTMTPLSTAYDTSITLEYIAKHDGASTTISHSENLDATNYAFNNKTSYNGGQIQQTESSQALLWQPNQTSATGSTTENPPINYNPGGTSFPSGSIDQISNSYNANADGFIALARPSSNHPGGAVVSFCDGSVKFIQQSMAYQVYATLMTSNGAQATTPGTAFTTGNPYYNQQLIPLDSSLIPSN